MAKLDLSTRTARKRLGVRSAPFWVRLAPGKALGYRRRKKGEPGQWLARERVGGERGSPYRWENLAVADDRAGVEADGENIMDYKQALQAAASWDPYADPEQPDGDGTVRDAVTRYLEWFEENRRSYQRTRYVLKAHVLDDDLADVPLAELTKARLQRWHQNLARKPARVRSRKHGKKQKVRHAETDDEKRARKVSANRALSILKAALNRAWEDGMVESRSAWQKVKPFRNVDRSRVRYLDREEAERLVNACDPDFRNLVLGAIYTGARYGELTRLRVGDMRFDADGIYIAESKSGNPRTVFLNDEALAFFDSLTAGRNGDELIFLRADGGSWESNHQQRRMIQACKDAKLKPRVVFHELRHTYASLYLMAGGGLPDLAKQLGHSTTRMVESNYGHLADTWRSERAKQFAPSLGMKPTRKTRRIRKAG